MISSDNDLTQLGLQFKKLNQSLCEVNVCRSAVTPTHFEVLQLLCDMLGKYRLPLYALQMAAPGYYI